ncbi:MAG: aspartate kinase [Planctomycetota bacterium]
MALVVMKFGGSSVATPDRIKHVASRVSKKVSEGHRVVVVVSAMGDTTNRLIALSGQISPKPDLRSYDLLLSTGEMVSIALLAMALSDLGVSAVPMTAYQLGIQTDSNHKQARVKVVKPQHILRVLQEGQVVVAAGFQGVSEDYHITTLGRGAGDKTAVILAAILKADLCEIYTDVEGVFTADPRIVPEARKLRSISCDEMLELATSGAKVMNSDSIEWAKKYNVPLVVRSTFSESEGSMIQNFSAMDDPVVVGAAASSKDARISVHGIKAAGGGVGRIFRAVSDAKVNVDMIVLTPTGNGFELSFTVPRESLDSALSVVKGLQNELGASSIDADSSVAKVSIVGVGMQNHRGVAARMFEALAKKGIQPSAVTTSEIKVSVLVPEARMQESVKALHDEFELSRDPQAIPS